MQEHWLRDGQLQPANRRSAGELVAADSQAIAEQALKQGLRPSRCGAIALAGFLWLETGLPPIQDC